MTRSMAEKSSPIWEMLEYDTGLDSGRTAINLEHGYLFSFFKVPPPPPHPPHTPTHRHLVTLPTRSTRSAQSATQPRLSSLTVCLWSMPSLRRKRKMALTSTTLYGLGERQRGRMAVPSSAKMETVPHSNSHSHSHSHSLPLPLPLSLPLPLPPIITPTPTYFTSLSLTCRVWSH